MKSIYRFLLILLPVLAITACETVPEESTESVEWQQHKNLLTQIKSYTATGKLGYKSPELKQSLNFIWNHSPESSQLRLTTFLGQTVLNLTLNDQGAKVIDRDGAVYTDKSATLLVYRLTGFVIPVDFMQDWLKGLPTEADSYDLKVDTNTLNTLSKQLGNQQWVLNYQSYQTVELIPLPYSMNLSQADTSLKILVSKWNIKK